MSIPDGTQPRIRSVWAHNSQSEFQHIDSLKREYPLISFDTEFPGSCKLEPAKRVRCELEHKYQSLRANVENMKLIQVGFTLTNERGELPTIDGVRCAAWEINLNDFNPATDLHVKSSIEMLRESGIDFERNQREGIDPHQFGSLLVRYGLVLNRNIKYICYAGDSDFAYLLKAVTGEPMPGTLAGFAQKVQAFFGTIYDIQHVQHVHFKARGGLQSFCARLGVRRTVGAAHQAGSDSFITASAYHIIRQKVSQWYLPSSWNAGS